MIKRTEIILLAALSFFTFAALLDAKETSACASLTGCEREICEKEAELEKAEAYNDSKKAASLRESLVYLKSSCSNTKISTTTKDKLTEIKEEYEEDLKEALDEYEEDRQEALSENNSRKLKRAEEKYKEKVNDIEEKYQKKLSRLQ